MIKTIIPYLLSCLTLYAMWAAGEKKKSAWVVGLANQVFWLTFIFMYHAYGLLPLTACLIVVYTRNYRKWTKALIP